MGARSDDHSVAMNSLTPETDAHSPASYAIIRPDGVRTDYVPADFARKLERERDEARNLADAAMWESDRLRSKLEKLVCERDEARLENRDISTFYQP